MDIHREHGRRAIGVDNIEEIAGRREVLIGLVESSELVFLGSEREVTIRCAINALSLRLRSPFMMRFEQEMSYSDVALKLDISINNVYKRISEARVILKIQMNKDLSEEDGNFLEIPILTLKKEKLTEANLNQGIQQGLSPILLTQADASNKALHHRGLQCFYCQSIEICKNGKRRGKQNYLCRKCCRQFIESYSAKGYPPDVKERCLYLYANGMSYRAIERETGVSHNTVINWVKQEATS